MESIIKKLENDDHYEREDGVDELYKYWYNEARMYAQGDQGYDDMARMIGLSMDTLTCFMQTWSGPSSTRIYESAVQCKKLEYFSKIVHVLTTKSKFQKLVSVSYNRDVPYHASLEEYINNMAIPNLQNRLDREQEKVLVPIYDVLNGILLLGIACEIEFTFDFGRIVQHCIKRNENVLVRQAGLKMIKTSFKTSKAFEILEDVAWKADSEDILTFLFMNGALGDEKVVKIVLSRITNDKVPLNARMKLRRHVLIAIHEFVKRRFSQPDVEEREKYGVRRIMEFSDMIMGSETEFSSEEADRGNEWIHVIEALLATEARVDYLKVALRYPSIQTLTSIGGAADSFSEKTWMEILLPDIKERIEAFNLDGVTGAAFDQEVINLLKDGLRIFYRDREVRRSKRMGEIMFEVVMEAIYHGYIQTERFPEAAAQIIITHNDTKLLSKALRHELSSTLKATRAIQDIVLDLLNNDHFVEKTLLVLCQTPTLCSWQILNDIFLTNEETFQSYPSLHVVILNSVRGFILQTIDSGEINTRILVVLNSMLCHMVRTIPLSAAEQLFEVILQAAALDPASSVKDETIRSLLEKMPAHFNVSQSAYEDALRTSGEEVRILIAGFAPNLCLEDKSAEVRESAIRALKDKPNLLQENGVVEALFNITNVKMLPNEQDYPKKQYFNDMIDAAAPTIATLAIAYPQHLLSSIKELIRLRILSKNYSDDGKANGMINVALSEIVTKSSFKSLVEFALSKTGMSMLQNLESLDESWKIFTDRLVREGYLERTKTRLTKNKSSELMNSVSAANSRDAVKRRTVANPSTLPDILMLLEEVMNYKMLSPQEYARDRDCGHDFLMKDLLPRIAAILPVPDVSSGYPVYSDGILNDAKKYILFLKRAQEIAPEEANFFLLSSKRIHDFCAAQVRRYVEQAQFQKASEFMQDCGLQIPILRQYIANAAEHSGQQASLASRKGLQMQPQPQQIAIQKSTQLQVPPAQALKPPPYPGTKPAEIHAEIENHAYIRIHEEDRRAVKKNEMIWQGIRNLVYSGKSTSIKKLVIDEDEVKKDVNSMEMQRTGSELGDANDFYAKAVPISKTETLQSEIEGDKKAAKSGEETELKEMVKEVASDSGDSDISYESDSESVASSDSESAASSVTETSEKRPRKTALVT